MFVRIIAILNNANYLQKRFADFRLIVQWNMTFKAVNISYQPVFKRS